jgi:hypothetical protein
MKLKTMVVSLVTLGLSGPLMAAIQPYYMDTSYQLDVMRDQMSKLDVIFNQNQPGGFDQPCGWTCRINISGWMNTDVYFANQPPVFTQFISGSTLTRLSQGNILIPTDNRASDLVLNNANLFIDARVNSWVKAAMSLVYSSLTGVIGSTGPYHIANSQFVYTPVQRAMVDTAYAMIGNNQISPVYLRVGKAYAPFGQYNPYAFVQSENPTQLLTEINEPIVEFGFLMPNGFRAAAYTFAGNPKLDDAGSTRRIQNGGVDLGYNWQFCEGNLNVDAGWLANIADSNYLSSYYLNAIVAGTLLPGGPNRKTPAWDLNADLTMGPFDINAHYVATTRYLLNPVYSARYFLTPLSDGSIQREQAQGLGKPHAWGVEAGWTFPVVAHQSRVALGWQQTTHLATFLPRKRFYIDYLVNFAKWFDMGFALIQDRDYYQGEGAIYSDGRSAPNDFNQGVLLHQGASGHKSTFGQIRASIKFA